MKPAICELNIEELTTLVLSLNQQKYRAAQIMRHISAFDSFDDYTDIPKSLIAELKERYTDRAITEVTRVQSSDGAVRYLFNTADDCLVESVFLPHNYGNSVCVSCQVGCAMGCSFCASGYYGLNRNLSAGEILSQVLYIARDKKEQGGVNKLVMMGSGEPLANYDNTLKFIRLVNAPYGLNIGMRSISLSTCGLPDKIKRLAKDGFTGTLSLSLHAPNDTKRKKIMKIAEQYSVLSLVAALHNFFNATRRRVMIEYILIDDFNTFESDALELSALLKGLCAHVNLIPLNPVENSALKACSKKTAYWFCNRLNELGISATVRRSMGSDVAGACGQLKNRTIEQSEKCKDL